MKMTKKILSSLLIMRRERTEYNEEHLRNDDQNIPQIPENSENIPEPHSEGTHLPEPGPTNPRSQKYDLRHNPKPNCNDDYRN